MKKLFYVIAFALALTSFGACNDEPDEPPVVNTGSGINSKDFNASIPVVGSEEVVMNLTFDAKDSWSISSPEKWCTIQPLRGAAGKSMVTMSVEANPEGDKRSAKVMITVNGFEEESLFTVVQGANTPEPTTMNGWIHQKMSECYLWNEEYRKVQFTDEQMEKLAASAFLDMGVRGVDAMDHINIEDGGWKLDQYGQTVREFFSYVKQVTGGILAPAERIQTRADKGEGFGFVKLLPSYFEGSQRVGVGVLAVYPDSPAAKAGIQRGTYINRINGTTLNGTNYETLVKQFSLKSGTVTFGTAVISIDNEGKQNINEKGPEYTLTASTYDESPLYYAGVISLGDVNQTQVGYLAYGQFDMAYDQGLIQIFQEFKEKNVTELILDLRYNGGGHVMSSTMLATLVAGSKYKDQVYTKMEYNKERTAAGKVGEYLIGNSIIPDGSGTYTLISDALQSSLNLDHVYVIGTYNTASASEMIINGLRGLGIEVRLIGQQTHGKNVGMEIWQQSSGTSTIELAPITFRAFNAKNECDYADGFVPDLIAPTENEFTIMPFGSQYEIMGGLALAWIVNGEKPNINGASLLMRAPGTVRRVGNGQSIDLSTQPKVKGALVFASENE